MIRFIVVDSTPLGLLTQHIKAKAADAARKWMADQTVAGATIVVPEIVDYELRRELIRSGKQESIDRLNALIAHASVTYLPLTTDAIRLAAKMWAAARNTGYPTADHHALDIDVILAAQVLAAGLNPAEFVVATANVGHIARFVPAQQWTSIQVNP